MTDGSLNKDYATIISDIERTIRGGNTGSEGLFLKSNFFIQLFHYIVTSDLGEIASKNTQNTTASSKGATVLTSRAINDPKGSFILSIFLNSI